MGSRVNLRVGYLLGAVLVPSPSFIESGVCVAKGDPLGVVGGLGTEIYSRKRTQQHEEENRRKRRTERRTDREGQTNECREESELSDRTEDREPCILRKT